MPLKLFKILKEIFYKSYVEVWNSLFLSPDTNGNTRIVIPKGILYGEDIDCYKSISNIEYYTDNSIRYITIENTISYLYQLERKIQEKYIIIYETLFPEGCFEMIKETYDIENITMAVTHSNALRIKFTKTDICNINENPYLTSEIESVIKYRLKNENINEFEIYLGITSSVIYFDIFYQKS